MDGKSLDWMSLNYFHLLGLPSSKPKESKQSTPSIIIFLFSLLFFFNFFYFLLFFVCFILLGFVLEKAADSRA